MPAPQCPLAVLCFLMAALPALPQALLGTARDVAVVDDFAGLPGQAWVASHGSNIAFALQPGARLPGVSPSVLRAAPRRVSATDGVPGNNWFGLTRTGIPAGAIPAGIDGFRVILASQAETQWWISFSVTTADGTKYDGMVGDRVLPGGQMVESLVPLAELCDAGGAALTPEKARTTASIMLAFSVAGPAIYLDRITCYRHDRREGWLDFSTSNPTTGLFERGQAVSLIFTPGGSLPDRAAGFRCEVRDYEGRVAKRATARLNGARPVRLEMGRPAPGYYEVQAYLTDTAGRDLERVSCLRGEGTVPEGVGTYAVLPVTVAENTARFRRVGQAAFFGLHGDFHGLADAVGLPWRLGYTAWAYLEPARPDRGGGRPAPWAAERLAASPQPSHSLHMLPFRPNLAREAPEWARSQAKGPPAFARWDDYLAMLRDYVRVERHEYPRMAPRLYGGAWEINLNMPPYVAQQPEHTAADVAELFRRTREVVREEDPGSVVLGPCPSVLDIPWFERVFRAGVLDHVDAIETHAYAEGAWNPEDNDYPGKLARLKALVRRYKGRDLPIYCTEAGFVSMLGARADHRAHAQRMARLAIILKGEGVRAFWAFYSIDFDRTSGFGFLFNKEVDPPNGPWHSRRACPKPVVNTMAVCAQLLEGRAPRRRVSGLGPDVWAYEFADASTVVTAVWAPKNAQAVRLPVRGARSVVVADMLGRRRTVAVTGGAVRLAAGPSVQYVLTKREKTAP